MGTNKQTGAAPDQQQPGEVERDNDALRPDESSGGERESTAQEHAKEQGAGRGSSSENGG